MDATDVKVTVLTCTYNRRHTLGRLRDSLLQQTFRDFEWLVVDDGSTDGTEELVAGWRDAGGPFPIRYYRKANGGKHSAHNYALPLIRGEYCAIIDSDDWYLPTGLADLYAAWQSIPRDVAGTFANVEGLVRTQAGQLLGSEYPADVFDSDNIAIQRLRREDGDTRGMHRTAVLREFAFPQDFEGKFVQEALVWNRMAQKYRTRFINKVVGGAEYLPGGLSDFDVEKMLAALGPRMLHLKELLEASPDAPLAYRAKLSANYLRLAIHRGTLRQAVQELPSRAVALGVLPVSALLYVRDKVHRWRSGLAQA